MAVAYTLDRKLEFEGRELGTGKTKPLVVRPNDLDPKLYGPGVYFARNGVIFPAKLSHAFHYKDDQYGFSCIGLGTGSGRIPGPEDPTVLKVEHVCAALYGAQIRDAIVEIQGPIVPRMEFNVSRLTAALIEHRIKSQYHITLYTVNMSKSLEERTFSGSEGYTDKIIVEHRNSGGNLTVLYIAGYPYFPRSIGTQVYNAIITPETFLNEISAARGVVRRSKNFSVDELDKIGITNYNALFVDELKGILNPLPKEVKEWSNLFSSLGLNGILTEKIVHLAETEFVRHKLLDFLGPVFLLGSPLSDVEITVLHSGHRNDLEGNGAFIERGIWTPADSSESARLSCR